MTRYNNPLPQNQVPPTQGRPAGAQQQQPYAQAPRPARPAAQGYPDTGYPANPMGGPMGGAHHDPYAALRPEGYGYAQPAQPAHDPYGLAGYTAPQPQMPAGQGYGAARPQQAQPQPQSYDPYAGSNGDPFGGGYAYGGQPAGGAPQFGAGKPAAQPAGYGAGSGYAAQPAAQPAPPFGAGYGAAPQQPAAYAPRVDAAPNGFGDQWGAQSLPLGPQDYTGHGYPNADLGTGALGGGQIGAQGQWGNDHYGDPQLDPSLGHQAYGNGQPQQASFDQSYAEDDAQYEEEPRRSGWKKALALVAITVVAGGGLTFAYSSIMGTNGSGPTPLVKGAEGPVKVKPPGPGGKQFAHTDSKLLGRLGENPEQDQSDPAGVRKVPVVVVGRDGSIQAPPAAAPDDQTRAVVSVPGLTVIDGLGGGPLNPNRPAAPAKAAAPTQMVTASEGASGNTIVVVPPKKKADVAVAKQQVAPVVQTKATVSPPPKKERVAVAVAATDPVATGPKPTGAGYVAVLASVPASDSSRIDALKQFADMQQKYGTILQNKTPDVQEANLGTKGTYHRLLVGPPGSRDSASSVCTQLKAEGYSGCWVTAY